MRQRILGLSRNYATVIAARAQNTTPKKRLGKALIVSLGVGSALGASLAYNEYRKRQSPPIYTNDLSTYLLDSAPQFKPSRTVTFPLDTTGLKLTLYQYQTCPFCCKVRAMLDFFGISYNIVEVNPVLRTQLKWSQKYRKVPILIVETPQGEVLQLNDSSMIISALFSFLQTHESKENSKNSNAGSDDNGKGSVLYQIVQSYPNIRYADSEGAQSDIMNKYFLMDGVEGTRGVELRGKEEVLDERKWRKWADTVFVHTLSPNIYRTLPEAVESFRNFDKVGEWDKNFSTWERTLVIYVGAFAMWMIGKKLQKRHHLKADVRSSLYEESDYWLQSIKKRSNGPFMGGEQPNLSDLAVYGVLSSIEGCTAFNDLSQNSKIIDKWYRKVQQHLKNSPRQVEV